ncbi:Piso0_002073 [Millerozyma farinosa CBS 7064]|uniref:Piso0_002073 protein n=1 Tax=Pichia sorbitophila (strain ATCC MYA-4447 / BCRC 22081 / CBS 7064 / NBRC 10061 / NRRL Y-12695) TaxID=559304 RepID=G8YBL9_PICSO|nr:Piso0_002073 [Millerozyma farinosa CBS 7064]
MKIKREILEHPVLRTPEKWLNIERSHNVELYNSGYYDPIALRNNPFANMLTDNKMDGSRIRFPIGQMHQLAVDFKKVDTEKKNLFLVPVVTKPELNTTLYAAQYILNNRKYINYIFNSGQWRRFIPPKFRFKNSSSVVSAVRPLSDFGDVLQGLLEQKLLDAWRDVDLSSDNSSCQHSLTLYLTGDDTEDIPVVVSDSNTSKIKMNRCFKSIAKHLARETGTDILTIPYDKNKELCALILQLAYYNS